MAEVDLHLHTTASDGWLTPTQLVTLLAEKGLRFAAITDHDSTEGLEEALNAVQDFPELTLIPGIELSTDVPGGEIHLLGYFIEYSDSQLQATLREFREGRLDRAKRMVEKLRELGIELDWERVQEIAGDGSAGRPHLAQAMVEKGYIKQPQEAFDKYIGRNGPAYAERQKLTPKEAVQMITSWGGTPVVAHPSYVTDLDAALEELKAVGLVGMEVYYAKYSAEQILELAEVAQRHGLLACGGSDYHAVGTPGEPLPGTMGPPPDIVGRLEGRAGKRA